MLYHAAQTLGKRNNCQKPIVMPIHVAPCAPSQPPSVAIIGAGPAGLMAAEVLSQAGLQVHVFEHKPSAARKFLMAGKGGLNISHSEPFAQLLQRYDAAEWLAPMLQQCDAAAIQQWMQSLGIASYIGSSGRIFPHQMKAAPLLRAWLQRLKDQGVRFHYRTRWLGWTAQGAQQFSAEQKNSIFEQSFSATVLALGGGSWPRLGSDAQGLAWLNAHGVTVTPLQAANVGVQVAWSPFMQQHAGQPLKRVCAWLDGVAPVQAEAVLTPYGLEGGLLYALGRPIRQRLQPIQQAKQQPAQQQHAVLYLDLLPDVSALQLIERLTKHTKDKQSQANIWRKAGLDGAKAALLREFLPKTDWSTPEKVAQMAKKMAIKIEGLQPIDEAISSAGGVAQNVLDQHLMLKNHAGVFCAGEMLDWDAPTGGYLLTACFASGRWAAQGVLSWLQVGRPM